MKMRIAYIGLLSIVLSACSTPKVVQEPTALSPLDAEYALDKRWQVKLEKMPNLDSEGLDFSEDSDTLFIASAAGHVVALKKEATSRWIDQVIWQTKFASPIVSGPAKHEDHLIVGSAKGLLIALAKETGQVVWEVQLSSEVMSHATIAEEMIFTRTVDGKLYAVDAITGKIVWVVEHQMPNLSLRGAPPVLHYDGTLFVGWESGVIQALSAKSGALLWETRIAVPKGRTDLERMIDVQANLVMKHNRLFVLGFHGKLASIDPTNGNFYFVKEISGYSNFVVDGSTIYVVDDTDVLHAFDLVNGANMWKQEALKGRLVGDLSFFNDKLLVADGLGYLHWIDRLQGIETARVKHSNDYGDGNRIVRVKVNDSKVTILDGEGVITRYVIKPSNLALFKAEHEDWDFSWLDKLMNIFKSQ